MRKGITTGIKKPVSVRSRKLKRVGLVSGLLRGIVRVSPRSTMRMDVWYVAVLDQRARQKADVQVTGSSDKTIRQWDVATGQCILTMDILWAISNPPNPPPEPARKPKLSHRSSTSFGSIHYDDILPSPGPSTLGMSGSSLLGAVSSGQFAIPTPPYADGSWEMYQDFVGGVQFWGQALASGSGDGAVRMWDSELPISHKRRS